MQTANYTDLRKNLKQYLDRIIDDSETMIVPRSGGKGVVMMSLDEYNSLAETEYLMSSPAMMKAIREAEQQIVNGEYISLNGLDEIQKYIDSVKSRNRNA